MGDRGKVIENKVADCDKQLAEIKAKMKGQKGMAYKQSQKRALMILKRRKMYIYIYVYIYIYINIF